MRISWKSRPAAAVAFALRARTREDPIAPEVCNKVVPLDGKTLMDAAIELRRMPIDKFRRSNSRRWGLAVAELLMCAGLLGVFAGMALSFPGWPDVANASSATLPAGVLFLAGFWTFLSSASDAHYARLSQRIDRTMGVARVAVVPALALASTISIAVTGSVVLVGNFDVADERAILTGIVSGQALLVAMSCAATAIVPPLLQVASQRSAAQVNLSVTFAVYLSGIVLIVELAVLANVGLAQPVIPVAVIIGIGLATIPRYFAHRMTINQVGQALVDGLTDLFHEARSAELAGFASESLGAVRAAVLVVQNVCAEDPAPGIMGTHPSRRASLEIRVVVDCMATVLADIPATTRIEQRKDQLSSILALSRPAMVVLAADFSRDLRAQLLRLN